MDKNLIKLGRNDIDKICDILGYAFAMYRTTGLVEKSELAFEYERTFILLADFMCSDDYIELDTEQECVEYIHG